MATVRLIDLLSRGRELKGELDQIAVETLEGSALLSKIHAWLKECVDFGRFLPAPSPDRRALQGRVDYWTSLLSQRGHLLPDIDRLDEFNSEAGFPLEAEFPYPGLGVYDEKLRVRFCGREDEANDAVAHLEENHTCLLISESGGGKSSLAMAGILPILKDKHPEWLFLPRITPGADPRKTLSAALSKAIRTPLPEHPEEFRQPTVGEFEAEPQREAEQVHGVLNGRVLVLFLDQLEELVTLCNDTSAQEAFSALVCALADPGNCRILATIRSDHLGRLDTSQACRPLYALLAAKKGAMHLEPLGFDAIRTAILKPAEEVGLRFVPPDLVDRLAQQTANLVGGLPLLQFALWRLWETRPRGKEDYKPKDLINEEQFKKLPNVLEALGKTAQMHYEALGNPAEVHNGEQTKGQKVCQRLMLELTVLAENLQDTMRRRRCEADIVALLVEYEGADKPEIQQLIDGLIKARLLVRTGKGEDAQIEVPHEAIFRNWPTFRVWVEGEETKGRLQALRVIGREAVSAAEHEYGRDYLKLKGEPLAKAREYKEKGYLDQESSEYVERCEQEERRRNEEKKRLKGEEAARRRAEEARKRAEDDAEEERRTKRLYRKSFFGLAFFAVLLFLAVVHACNKDQEAKTARYKLEMSAVKSSIDGNRPRNGLAHLAAAIRLQDNSLVARELIIEILTRQSWPLLLLQQAELGISWLRFSLDGNHVVTVSRDGTAQVWDVSNGKLLVSQPLEHMAPICTAQFSPDVKRMVTAAKDGQAKLWALNKEKPVLERQIEYKGEALSIQFSLDGSKMVIACRDGTAQVWDVQSGNTVGQTFKHHRAVVSAQFSSDGNRVVTASEDGTAQLWDVSTGKALLDQPLKHDDNATVWSALFSPDGNRILTASADWTAQVWDAGSGKRMLPQPLKHNGPVLSAKFSTDGNRILTASADYTAQLWDASSGKPILPQPLKHNGPVLSAKFSPDEEMIVTASWDGMARVWNASTGKQLSGSGFLHDDAVISIEFSPEGRRVLTLSQDGVVRVWQACARNASSFSLRHKDTVVVSARFDPEGKRIVTASRDHTAQLWDAYTGKAVGQPFQHKDEVLSAEFSPDGNRIITASRNGTIQVWDANTGKEVGQPFQHNGVLSAEFSPDGNRVVAGSQDGTARVWDVNTWKQLGQPIKHDGAVLSAQFSPDGNHVVTASADHTAQVWNADTGKPVFRRPLSHLFRVRSARFSRDGTLVVTASDDGTTQIWHADDGSPSGETLGGRKDAPVLSAQFSTDTQRVLTISQMGTVRVWDRNDARIPVDLLLDTTDSSGEKMVQPFVHFSPDG